MASSPITSWQTDGETMEIVIDFISLGSKFTADNDCSHEIKTIAPWKKSYDKLRQCNKKQRHYFANKGPHGQSYGFSSSHVWMWELDYKESWALKNWCFWTVVLEKTLENPLESKEIKPVNPKGNQPWIFIGRTEVPILWPPDAKSPLIVKDSDAEKDDWMASPIQWIWLWAGSRRWWKTGKPGLLQSMGVSKSQTRLSHWTTVNIFHSVQWYRL